MIKLGSQSSDLEATEGFLSFAKLLGANEVSSELQVKQSKF